MILNGEHIVRKIERDEIRVSPEISHDQVQPASLDVRLGERLYDVAKDEETKQDETHLLEPRTPYIGHTADHIRLPKDLAALLTGRSTFGRKFVLMHITAGWIDPGFDGEITLEIYNLSNEPVEVDVGERVAQLVFFRMIEESSGYDGRYQGQEGITLDRD